MAQSNSSFGGGGLNFDGLSNNVDNEKLRKEIIKNENVDHVNYFNPLRFSQKEDPLIKGLPIIFITTPTLNLNKINLSRTGFFRYMRDCEPNLIKLLNFGGSSDGEILGTGSPFIKILTNQFENISFGGVSMRTKEMNETFYGFKQMFPSAMIDSITANTISIEYSEDKNLNVLKLHKAWTDYIEYARRGIIRPSEITQIRRTIDFSSSIYYFLLDFDFQTILYYSKYTGCSPINVPYDALASSVSGGKDIVRVGIEYAYGYKEDMNPDILYDFNIVSSSASQLNDSSDVERVMYENAVEMNLDNSKDIIDENYDNIKNVGITLENYGDNREKRRYKLKFFNNALPQSKTYQENKELLAEDLNDKNSYAYQRAKTLLKEYENKVKEFGTDTIKNMLEPGGIINKINSSAKDTANNLKELNEIAKNFQDLTGTSLNAKNYKDMVKKFS